ncbi:MAG TPA: peptidase MA family metallohydrolase [Dehalococcoidia bacterium]|nr:peptidase MA family metallohydrolase [Dehalococcoidia bacterium]
MRRSLTVTVLPSIVLLLALLSAATYLGTGGVQAQTQTDGIQVTSQGAESQFPDQMRFYLTARSPDEINEVRLFFKKSGQVSSAYRAVEFTPGITVNGQTLIRLGLGDAYLPPGAELQYYFELRDRGQRVLRTPTQTFLYEDTRLQWRSITGGLITVYYSGGVTEARAKAVLEASQESMTRMLPVLGIQPTRPLRIVAYGSYQDMRGALPFRARAVQEQLVTEGQAFTDERVLLVLASGSGIRGITAHEFSHLLVAEAAGTAIQRVPAWLNEGLAEYANPEPMPSYDQYLRRAIQDGKLQPLWHLIVFGGTPEDIIIAYGHSSSVVEYLITTHGEAKIAEVMRALKTTLDIDRALEQVYGFDQYGLDSAWRKSMGLQPSPPRQTAQPPTATSPAPTPAANPTLVPTASPTPTLPAAAPPATTTSGPTPNTPVVPPGAAGCSLGAVGASPDLAWLALLGAVAGMIVVRRVRRS